MTENEIVNPEVVSGTPEVEPKLLPLVMLKGKGEERHHAVIGQAAVYLYPDHTEIIGTLDTEDGQLAGEFLSSNMVMAISIGGVLDRSTAEAIVNGG
jgi:hypothetical protein